VGIAHQKPDMVGNAHPTDTDIYLKIKPDSYTYQIIIKILFTERISGCKY